MDIFSAVLSGANYGPWVPPYVPFLRKQEDQVGNGIGHFFGAFRIDAFRSKKEFKINMDKWIDRFRNAEPIDPENKVQIPGDQERKFEKDRLINGIPLFNSVLEDLPPS